VPEFRATARLFHHSANIFNTRLHRGEPDESAFAPFGKPSCQRGFAGSRRPQEIMEWGWPDSSARRSGAPAPNTVRLPDIRREDLRAQSIASGRYVPSLTVTWRRARSHRLPPAARRKQSDANFALRVGG